MRWSLQERYLNKLKYIFSSAFKKAVFFKTPKLPLAMALAPNCNVDCDSRSSTVPLSVVVQRILLSGVPVVVVVTEKERDMVGQLSGRTFHHRRLQKLIWSSEMLVVAIRILDCCAVEEHKSVSVDCKLPVVVVLLDICNILVLLAVPGDNSLVLQWDLIGAAVVVVVVDNSF